jgi:hypothetical protein
MAKKKGGVKFTILPLTPDLWPALEELFGKPGASNGWCMYWRLGGAYREAPRGANREALRKIVNPPRSFPAKAGNDTAVESNQVHPFQQDSLSRKTQEQSFA